MTGSPACGDVMKLQIKLKDDIIEDVKFKTYGCGSAIASSTMFVDMLKGKTIEEAKLIKDKDIASALELPPIKLHCSVLAEDSIRKAIENWEEKITHRRHNYLYPHNGM
jgi:nitrogen fixation NifU-like protein